MAFTPANLTRPMKATRALARSWTGRSPARPPWN